MATLRGLEGQAHVEIRDSLLDWGGYIVFAPSPRAMQRFDARGLRSLGIYEGPVRMKRRYYHATGNIIIRIIIFNSSGLKLVFVGNGKINIVRSLSMAPDDYLPDELEDFYF